MGVSPSTCGEAVDGWCSVEELTRWGFARAPVVMANEVPSGLARCIRTRDIGVRMIEAAPAVASNAIGSAEPRARSHGISRL